MVLDDSAFDMLISLATSSLTPFRSTIAVGERASDRQNRDMTAPDERAEDVPAESRIRAAKMALLVLRRDGNLDDRQGGPSPNGNAGSLFGMRPDAFNAIGVADDLEIESPGERHASLPGVFEPTVLLRVKRGMVEVLKEKSCLFVKRFTDWCRRIGQSCEGRFRILKSHRADLAFRFAIRNFLMFFSTDAASASAVLNGP